LCLRYARHTGVIEKGVSRAERSREAFVFLACR
jgi:hypothetical protein